MLPLPEFDWIHDAVSASMTVPDARPDTLYGVVPSLPVRLIVLIYCFSIHPFVVHSHGLAPRQTRLNEGRFEIR